MLLRLVFPALNALNLAMMELMKPKLEAWERSDDCNVVLLKSEGRAFCAGGDVVALVNAAREEATREQSVSFFAQEYTLDRWLARMSKPLVAFADGITSACGDGAKGLTGRSGRRPRPVDARAVPDRD